MNNQHDFRPVAPAAVVKAPAKVPATAQAKAARRGRPEWLPEAVAIGTIVAGFWVLELIHLVQGFAQS